MWYAMQVLSGREYIVEKYCRERFEGRSLGECFIARRRCKRKFRGEWKVREENMFPGYLFLITGQIREVYHQLKAVPELTKLLGDSDGPVPLDEREIAFLKEFGGSEHVIDMNEGYIAGERIIVTSGPLKGKEGMIVKLDRHKRTARIRVEFFGGRQAEVGIGLEIVRKEPG